MKHTAVDIAALYRDRHVPAAPRGSKHHREGWINTHCPFCAGSRDYHLGYNLAGNYFYCWRCGWKTQETALAGLLDISERKARALIGAYKTRQTLSDRAGATISPRPISTYLPKGSKPFSGTHTRYLSNRGFDPDELVEMWGLKATDHTAESGWKWRIVIPIYFERELVSYTTRSIGNKPDKYRACPKQQEKIHHKNILYGWDGPIGGTHVVGPTAIVVEGPADVWRVGPGAVAIFGDQVSPAQVALLKNFRRLFVMLDGDEAGKVAGEKLAWRMSGMGVDAQQIILPDGKDPGELGKNDVLEIRRDLLLGDW
jgi:hypothetical protein